MYHFELQTNVFPAERRAAVLGVKLSALIYFQRYISVTLLGRESAERKFRRDPVIGHKRSENRVRADPKNH